MSRDDKASGGSRRGSRYELLLAESVPEILQRNAFRLTQLPTTATQREVDRQVERVRMAEKLGVPLEAGGLLPVPGGVGAEALREAVQRLRDPQKRLIDELFWFWPLKDGDRDDPGLAALRSGALTQADAVWVEAGGDGGQRAAIAVHNRAVLALVGALDAGLNAAAERQEASSEGWSKALELWDEARRTAPLWTTLARRVEDIGDPRLTAEIVWDIRQTLPECLASIAANLGASLSRLPQMIGTRSARKAPVCRQKRR